ncbi:MAG: leucine-rich repeat protein [Lachnospiraceae bacterium]|nr:leucine-rich repeat protein [Lachnospiraceae bacterium]
MNKKVIFIVCAIIMAIPLAGLLWWFFPYIHPIRGVDEEAGYRYVLEGKYCYLTKYIGKETIVYVPEQLKGRKVIIYGGCFYSTRIEEIYVPSTIEVPSIAFGSCSSLKKFSGSSNTIIYERTFADDVNLEEVTFTNGIERIEEGAFYNCQSLHTVDFMGNVNYLGDFAFDGSGIEKIPVMENLEYVGSFAFHSTPWERNLNSDFAIVGDTLLNYKGTEKEVHIPDGVSVVRTAFINREPNEYAVPVEKVYIPNTVKTLGSGVFIKQENLTVYIPDSVIEIGIDEKGEESGLGGDIKIITTSGSYAEEYAKENGIEYEIVDGWDEAEIATTEVEQREAVSFNEKYTQVSGSYAVEGDAFAPFMYDIDEDGKADKIELLCEVSNNNAIESLTLQVGDLEKSIINAEDMSEELIYKDLKCYILHIGEKNLIYIHTSYALDDLYFGVVCEVTESGINVLNDKAGISIDDQPLVDPQNVVCRTENGLLDRVGYFYTLSCWKFDEAGQVSRKKETEYFLSEGFKVKTIAELTADEVGEDDAVVESQVVLPVGAILVPLRTDNETYVDFTSEEGKIYRVPFEVGIEDDVGRTGFIQGTVASEWMVVVV